MVLEKFIVTFCLSVEHNHVKWDYKGNCQHLDCNVIGGSAVSCEESVSGSADWVFREQYDLMGCLLKSGIEDTVSKTPYSHKVVCEAQVEIKNVLPCALHFCSHITPFACWHDKLHQLDRCLSAQGTPE